MPALWLPAHEMISTPGTEFVLHASGPAAAGAVKAATKAKPAINAIA